MRLRLVLLPLSMLVMFSCENDNDQDLAANAPLAGCDTTNVTYTRSIAPIFTQNCTGCHGASNPSGGLHLNSFSNVTAAEAAMPGVLVGVTSHAAGFSAMPPSGAKLPACSLEIIRRWVQAGMPN